jgi:signal transduction histidine kinase
LARQICEAHGGVLQVTNRLDGQGCNAEVRLPFTVETQTELEPEPEIKTVSVT